MKQRRNGNRANHQAAKAARRKATVAEKRKAELLSQSLAGRVAAAARSPVEHCLRSAGLFGVGIGQVVLARRLPSGLLGCAFFLVDVWCLGAKDVSYRELTPSDFDEARSGIEKGGALTRTEPACARKLVAGAVAFAATSNIQPARSYHVVQNIFGDVPQSECGEAFAFGRDGIPTYHDNVGDPPARVREIMAALEKAHGPDGWDVMADQSIASPFGRMTALIHAMKDQPGLAALRREIEAHDAERGLTIDHDPSPEPDSG